MAFPKWLPLTLRIPHGDPIMYGVMHLRCLVFKLHKIIGQKSFQICTGESKFKIAPILMKHISKLLFVLTKRFGKGIIIVYLIC